MRSLGNIFIPSCNKATRKTRVIFLYRGKLEKFKLKEMNRLPAYIINAGMPIANIECSSCLEYPQGQISSSIAAASFIAFKTMKMIRRKTSLQEHSVF